MDSKSELECSLPPMCIGVMGSAGGKIEKETFHLAYLLGETIAKRKHVLITGACPGLPQESVKGALKQCGVVVGVSPALNIEEHVRKYHSPTRGYHAIIYTGSGLMGREIENIRSCDVVIFVGGRSGTLGEFAIAYDEAKVIGVLQGSGGITKHIDKIITMVEKETGAIVLYDTDPEILIKKAEQVYKDSILPRKMEALRGHDPDGSLGN